MRENGEGASRTGRAIRPQGRSDLSEGDREEGSVSELSSSVMRSDQSSNRLSGNPEAMVAHQRSLTSCKNGTASVWLLRLAVGWNGPGKAYGRDH